MLASDGTRMDQWWLLGRDRKPIGPASTDLVLQGILAGRVPSDSLVCEVGGPEWLAIRDVPAFKPAFAKLRIDGPTMVDPPELIAGMADGEEAGRLRRFDSQTSEHTVADAEAAPSEPPDRPTDAIPLKPKLQRFEEGSEQTVVDEPLVDPSR